MSFELKVKLIEVLNVIIQVLQGLFLLGIFIVAWLEWKRGKKAEYVTPREMLKTFIIGFVTCIFFLALVGVPWTNSLFWIIGGAAVVFGCALAGVMKSAGFSQGKLRIKNYRLYAIVWLITVFVGEFALNFLTESTLAAPASFLFGFAVLTTVTIFNGVRYHKAKLHA